MIERYTRTKMGALFTDKYKFETWLKVELAVCEAWSRQGEFPKDVYMRIKKNARFKLKRIEEIENQVHHDVIAFTTAVGDYIGNDSAYFHKGLTSSDVVDTAQSMVLKQAGQHLEEGLAALKDAVGKRALEHKHTPAMGRTHGVHAEPTTFGLKLLIWYDELTRHEERLASAIDNIAVGKLSGAVGNFAHIPPEFEEKVLKQLGLQAAPVSNQIVQRDRHAQFICTLAQIAATMEKIAINLRTSQRTEIGEVQEPFAKGQKGSSAMPHKKNPILLERVTGLARVLRGYAVTALENVALWDERDISHSGAERVILPDACILLDYMMDKLAGVVAGLEINTRRLERNIYFTKGLIFSQGVLLALTEGGLSREQAYALVQKNAMRCWEDETPLMDALLNDREVRTVLGATQISALFSLEPFLAHVDSLFERVGLVDGSEAPAKAKKPAPARKTTAKKPVKPKGKPVGPVDAVAVETGAIQNIGERAEDYFESIHTILDSSFDTNAGDDTLGEPDHEKEVRQKRMAAGKAAQKAGKAKPAAKPRRTSTRTRKPAAKKAPGEATSSTAKPASAKPETAPPKDKTKAAAKPRRRPAGKPKPQEKQGKQDFSSDDSYVD